MRLTLALALTAGLAAAAAPAVADPPRTKPANAGPRTPKAPKLAAATSPKARPAPKTVTSPKPTKAPKTAPAAAPTVGTGTATTSVRSNVPKNPKLAARLQAMLPAGMSLEQAASGFKNQGQFIAAANVANNKGISFVDLKTSMVDGGLSLGQSIQQLKPSLDGKVEAARATRWAEQQIEPR